MGEQTKLILKQAGLEFGKENIEWLNLHTRYIVGHAAFGTSRDAVKSAFAWRSNLNISIVREIEEKCGNTMRYLGYEKLKTVEHQENPKFYTTDPTWNNCNQETVDNVPAAMS